MSLDEQTTKPKDDTRAMQTTKGNDLEDDWVEVDFDEDWVDAMKYFKRVIPVAKPEEPKLKRVLKMVNFAKYRV